eukprot:3168815-Prymnesium_polylepis.1
MNVPLPSLSVKGTVPTVISDEWKLELGRPTPPADIDRVGVRAVCADECSPCGAGATTPCCLSDPRRAPRAPP